MKKQGILSVIILLFCSTAYGQSSQKNIQIDSSSVKIIGNTVYRAYQGYNTGAEDDWKTSIRYAKVVVLDVLFETSRAEIKARSFSALNTLSTILEENPAFKIKVAGHTDKIGDSKKNLKLSKKRAKAVKKYLKLRGIKAKRIEAKGFGDSMPICEAPCAENRRVAFSLVVK